MLDVRTCNVHRVPEKFHQICSTRVQVGARETRLNLLFKGDIQNSMSLFLDKLPFRRKQRCAPRRTAPHWQRRTCTSTHARILARKAPHVHSCGRMSTCIIIATYSVSEVLSLVAQHGRHQTSPLFYDLQPSSVHRKKNRQTNGDSCTRRID